MIEAQSYSSSSGSECPLHTGHVKLNGREVWSGALCSEKPDDDPDVGIHLFEIDPFRCTVYDSERFDTNQPTKTSTEEDALVRHLIRFLRRVVRPGVVVIGVTAGETGVRAGEPGVTTGEPGAYLDEWEDELSVLQNIYGVDVGDVEITGSFAFVAQKEYPEKAALVKVLTAKESNEQPARLNVTITGMHNLNITSGIKAFSPTECFKPIL